MKRLTALTALLVCLLAPMHAWACAWDRDTLAMERAEFPETIELIAGYFARHSPAYYRWRLEQVLAIPADQRTAADYDDLGVSHDKLGQHDEAVAAMLEKIGRFPGQGAYESHANLGTFYIHGGDLTTGVEHIAKAIEINPDAHFGREIYQELLVRYVIERRATGNTLPLEPGETVRWSDDKGPGFASYVIKMRGISTDNRSAVDQEIQAAIKGVLGMMRFGNYKSPVLLEALGDLLFAQTMSAGVQRLAVRAYLKASYEVEDADAANLYREKAELAVANQENTSLAMIESNLKKEIAEGDRLFAQIEEDEQKWITEDKDVDAAFIRAYYESGPIVLGQPFPGQGPGGLGVHPLEWVALGALVLVAAGGLAFYVRRPRRAEAAA